MPNQIVPYIAPGPIQQYNPVSTSLALGTVAAPWTQQLVRWASKNHDRIFKATKDAYPRLKRAFTSSGKPTRVTMPSGYTPRRSYRKRSRKSMYKKRPRSVRKVQSIRKKARKRGNVRAAKKLVLPLGGFQDRRIIRLKDVVSFKAHYTGIGLDGNSIKYNGVDHDVALAAHLANPSVHADPGLGLCQQYVFRMNDLRNFYCQGKFVKKGSGALDVNTWEEPTLNHDQSNKLRKIPLSRVHANTFRKYTVIGSEMVIRLTNNELSKFRTSSGGTPGDVNAVTPAHKIWYAWRLVAASAGAAADIIPEIPQPVAANTTYQALKETGKWRMGIVSSATADKMAQRTFKIPFNSKRLFGAEEGKPGSPNVTGLMTSPGTGGESPESYTSTVGGVNHMAYLQLIIGPQNLSNMDNRQGAAADGSETFAFGSVSPTYGLSDVQVDITTNFYVALSDPYPIQIVDADGIEYPIPGASGDAQLAGPDTSTL